MVEVAKETNLTEAEIKARIAHCDVFMLSMLSTAFSSVESTASPYKPQPDEINDRYLAWLRFAVAQGKTSPFIPAGVLRHCEFCRGR